MSRGRVIVVLVVAVAVAVATAATEHALIISAAAATAAIGQNPFVLLGRLAIVNKSFNRLPLDTLERWCRRPRFIGSFHQYAA
jgi:hypothetical protein